MNHLDNFNQYGYCIIKSAISEELRDFVTQYALFDEQQNFLAEKDTIMQGAQVPDAHSKYADPAMETMLLHLHKIMQDSTGLKLHPTYSYYRVYRPGDKLEAHTDRPSCEISATLCFNYSYESNTYRWPIFMEGNRVDLEPGDMVIYKGCDLTHWRNQFNIADEQAWHVQGFFHYVDANGPHAEHKYDSRPNVGTLVSAREKTVNKPYITYTK
jgi:hypothetical protein